MRPLLDLLFPLWCVCCGRPGTVACPACAEPLRGRATVRVPSPSPPRLPTPYAVADYAGTTRDLVLAYKERDVLALTGPLAGALATAIAAAAVAGPALVVPVPASPAAIRRRGFDPVARLARTALIRSGAAGRCGATVRALEHVRAVDDSAGLSAVERSANLAGALRVRPRVADRLRGRPVVVVDDVITTGATLAEATRALREAGAAVVGAATVAATSRRR